MGGWGYLLLRGSGAGSGLAGGGKAGGGAGGAGGTGFRWGWWGSGRRRGLVLGRIGGGPSLIFTNVTSRILK